MQQNSALVTVRVKPDVAARLEKLAESMERSKSYLAAEAIEEYLEIHEWQVQAIQEGIAAADRGETISFDEIKKQWEKKIEDSDH
jgi:RHH-type transcriptional regulator, rel operon repressor / antitoxin RelB